MDKLSILEIGQVDEWIYYAVLPEDYGIDEVYEIIDVALKSVFSGEPVIRESELDESIESELKQWERKYKNKKISRDEYEKSVLEEREKGREELVEIAHETILEDGFAASQLLVALLGNQTSNFENILDANSAANKNFIVRYEELKNSIDKNKLKLLIEDAVKVVKKLKTKEGIQSFDFHDDEDNKDLIDMIEELENNLLSSQN